MSLLLYALLVSIGINIVMFVPAYLFKTDKVTDISYAVTFVAVALSGFWQSTQTTLQWVVLLAVTVWAVRLGGFLLIRIQVTGKDARFDGIRENFWRFLRFWLAQAVSVFVIMLAALLGDLQTGTISFVSWLGLAVFLAGVIIEATADIQKFRFNADPANKNKWIDGGIWRASRHPNYLGEMMVWIGMYILVAPSLSGVQLLIALISPAYIISLLLFVSGVPLLEKSAQKRWGDSAAFKTYTKEVPVLVPTLRSIKRALR